MAAHAALKLFVRPPRHTPREIPAAPRPWLAPAIAFVVGCVLGYLIWNTPIGPGLVFLAAPLLFRAARPRRPTPGNWVFLTPLLMLVAAIGTATIDVFGMIVVFLPMCVASMAGIVSAEFADALSKQTRVPMSTVIAWAVRFTAESILGTAVALVILWR